MGVKAKARNRILFLNPGQVVYSLNHTDLIELKVCLFDCKMFCVNNNMKIKTIIKISYPLNQRVAGQVNFRLLLESPQRRKTGSRDGMTGCVCDLFSVMRFIMTKERLLAIKSKHCRGKTAQNWGWDRTRARGFWCLGG